MQKIFIVFNKKKYMNNRFTSVKDGLIEYY